MAGPVTPAQSGFASAVLQGIGAPVTPQNINGFIGWSIAEGPLGGSSWARNNPLNTTEGAGAVGTINSAGVKAYGSPQAGIAATVKTLLNGNYGGIVNAFKTNNPGALGSAVANSPWGTGALAEQTIAQQLGQPVPRPATLGSTGAPASSPTSVQIPGFDSTGFNAAQARYIAGSFLGSGKSVWDAGQPKGSLSLDTSPLFAQGLLTKTQPNPADYQTTQTVQLAQNSLQQLAGGSALNIHPAATPGYSGYVNPFARAQSLVPERVDMGQDFSMAPGSPIDAPGNSKVLGIKQNWYSGQPYVALQFLDGPNAGKNYYVAEQITPNVKPGDVVHAGQAIGTYSSSGTGIEMGYAGSDWQQTLAQATGNTGDATHGNSPAGQQFQQFLQTLGVK